MSARRGRARRGRRQRRHVRAAEFRRGRGHASERAHRALRHDSGHERADGGHDGRASALRADARRGGGHRPATGERRTTSGEHADSAAHSDSHDPDMHVRSAVARQSRPLRIALLFHLRVHEPVAVCGGAGAAGEDDPPRDTPFLRAFLRHHKRAHGADMLCAARCGVLGYAHAVRRARLADALRAFRALSGGVHIHHAALRARAAPRMGAEKGTAVGGDAVCRRRRFVARGRGVPRSR